MNTAKSLVLLFIPVCLLLASNLSYASHAAIIIDAANGNVLHQEDATHTWYPASLTKVMTLYMTFDALKAGEIHLSDQLTASPHAARQPQSKLGLRQGEKITVQEAILAVITRSANDAAVVLSEHLGGTEENFAIKMTAMAHNLGMYDSHFMNATGLPHPWQVTTARDMASLALKTQQNFPNYYPYFSAHSFMFKGRELRGINKFTASYPGAEGMKTGFTCGSGYNLISTANQNGKRLIGVILGGMTSPERYQLMIKMMNNGFANRIDANSDTNINSMPNNTGGTPPVQLGCGNMRATSTSSDSTNAVYIPKARPINRHHHNAHHTTMTHSLKKANTTKPITKVKPKVVAKSKIKATKTEKPNKTRYHHPK